MPSQSVWQTLLLRYGSALVRYVPINRRKEGLVHRSLNLNRSGHDFQFYCPRIRLRWSAAGYPDLLTRHLLFEGVYQEDVIAGIQRLVRPGDTVLDVGGHHGLMAVTSALAAGPAGRVITFEPNPQAQKLIARHAELNNVSNIAIEAIALGASEGAVSFFMQSGAVSWNSSIFRDFASQNGRDEIVEIRVPMMTLDSYVEKQNLRPSLIKIDAEGSEQLILQGALKTIQKHRPVTVVEFNPESAAAAGTTVEAAVRWFHDQNYDLVTLERQWNGHYEFSRQKRFEVNAVADGHLENVFCLPR